MGRRHLPHSILRRGLTLLSLLVPASAAAQRRPLDGLDAYIQKAMAEWQVPGLAIAVVRNDSVVYLKGFGVREVGKPGKVDPQTVFALSSNSKAFGAAAAGILVDEGKLAWDDPVIKYLPSFQLPDPWVTRQATIRDLLAHRIAGDLGSASGALWIYTALSGEEIIRRLRYLDAGANRFREGFEYNNPNIMAAALVVAAVSGMSWDAFMKQRMFGPLEMTSATTSVLDLWDVADVAPCFSCELPGRTVGYERAKISNIVMPHIPTDRGPLPIPWRTVDNIGPGGSINANVADVAKFVRMQLARGTYRGRRILSAAAVDELHSPQMVIPDASMQALFPSGHFSTYGLGWFMTDYRDRKLVFHTGAIAGFLSAIAFLPEENLGIAVLTNLGGHRLPLALAAVVFDRYLGGPERDWSDEWRADARAVVKRPQAARPELTLRRITGTRPSRPARDLVGVYSHPAFGDLVVEENAGSLTLRLAGVISADVEHWHYDLYRVQWPALHPAQPRLSSLFLSYDVNTGGGVARLNLQFVDPSETLYNPWGHTMTTFTRVAGMRAASTSRSARTSR